MKLNGFALTDLTDTLHIVPVPRAEQSSDQRLPSRLPIMIMLLRASVGTPLAGALASLDLEDILEVGQRLQQAVVQLAGVLRWAVRAAVATAHLWVLLQQLPHTRFHVLPQQLGLAR